MFRLVGLNQTTFRLLAKHKSGGKIWKTVILDVHGSSAMTQRNYSSHVCNNTRQKNTKPKKDEKEVEEEIEIEESDEELALEEVQIGGMLSQWPRSKVNTIANVCHQGEQHVIERFGRLHHVQSAGLYFALPFVDRIKYRIDMREKAIPIDPQTAISRDNVSIRMSGVLYTRFIDAESAAYGHYNPLFAVIQHAQSAMRAAVGDIELDRLFHDRNLVNKKITEAIRDAAENWGLSVLRYEVTDISPDRRISDAMDKQAAAERNRREQVLQASGQKESEVLRSEGILIARTNEAEAKKRELELHAQGQANAVLLEAEAQRKAIEAIASALYAKNGGGVEAARLTLAEKYISMMGEMGAKSNTIFFGEQPGDMSAMMARIGTAFQVSQKATTDQK